MKKKKVLIASDFSKLKTGFGRNAKTVFQYLHGTGKYDLIEYACAPLEHNDVALKSVPWKAYGSMPTDRFLREELDADESRKMTVKYGGYYIDDIIEKEKPDCYLGINDFWAFKEYCDKPWWNKVNCAIWTTVDSLPLYEDLVHNAHQIKNLWVWSKFAENELKRLGFDHAQTLHGAFDVTQFRKLENRQELRAKAGIAEDEFIIGFVFRNQVRKLIGTLLEGFAMHKFRNPESKAKLLLHTSWSEGWDIKRFIKEFDVNPNDILTTHVCLSCRNYTVKPYTGEEKQCGYCGNPKGLITPKTYYGVEEESLNEIYNLMDFYIHPVTSGGLEMPMVEALLAGVPISTCDYSCGEEFCEQPFVLPIKHTLYREFGTQFMKSQPLAESVCSNIGTMVMHSKRENGSLLKEVSRDGTEWAQREFDHKIICKRIEDWIDSCPEVDHSSYNLRKLLHNPTYKMKDIEDDLEWTIDSIRGIFGYEKSANSPTVQTIVEKLKNGTSRETIFSKAASAALQANTAREKSAVEEFFPNDSDTNNIAFIAPRDFSKKLSLLKHVKDLKASGRNLYIIGDALDEELYQQIGKLKMIPITDRSPNPEWLKSLKNKKGETRFKEIHWEHNNNLISVDNEG